MTKPEKLRSDGLSWREIDGEVVAVDVATSTYLAANESGALLWRLLAEGATRDVLVRRLGDHFRIDLERAAADVDAFLGALDERGLLQP